MISSREELRHLYQLDCLTRKGASYCLVQDEEGLSALEARELSVEQWPSFEGTLPSLIPPWYFESQTE
jgi:hypothetical protein